MQVGDIVTRMLSGTIPMKMKITELDEQFIHCGPWKFDRQFGYEVDEDLGWGVPDPDTGELRTGSYLKEVGKTEL